ncbi:MAG TPA: 5-formyltetrahydrofolate cyclo-ligase [Gammaproteobacteria bacterium]|nr:5-formyltetrahydrofolate cyclo-ligase [Gammaproteobacteria bacterium]
MKRDELRRHMRGLRAALPPAERRAAAEAAARVASATPQFRTARRIAAYVAIEGELDPEPLLTLARAQGKEVYLPVLPPTNNLPLSFLPYAAGATLRPNRYRIPEPAPSAGAALAPVELDLVFAPLVAFDARGQRLGMGGGFYDRSFAFLKAARTPHPALIGYAYECQRAEGLDAEAWDVPLVGVVTEQRFYAFP